MVDGSKGKRPRRGWETVIACVEQACRRSLPREQHYALGGFCPFMVAALENDELVQEALAIVGCQIPLVRTVRAGIIILFLPRH